MGLLDGGPDESTIKEILFAFNLLNSKILMLTANQKAIETWYQKQHRDLPWRNTNDAYRIWLSEIILQQTRVQQGLPYYERFIKAYPTLGDFANAKESDLLLLWQGLGYYSRVRNMHYTAKSIVDHYQGQFPKQYEELLKLKGIGEYTAAAIASFAFELPYPAIDGNLMRVIARLYGIDDDIAKQKTRKVFTSIASEMMKNTSPSIFNQSMMEFGAIQCKPKSPDCSSCPVQNQCVAFAENRVSRLPVKLKKTTIRSRYLNYLIIKTETKSIFIKQIKGKGIWQNLHEFPMIESKHPLSEADFLQEIRKQYSILFASTLKYRSPEIKHRLSHQLLHIHFNILTVKEIKPDSKWQKIVVSQLSDFPFPEIINKNKDLILKHL